MPPKAQIPTLVFTPRAYPLAARNEVELDAEAGIREL
jgi:hypothetical protein